MLDLSYFMPLLFTYKHLTINQYEYFTLNISIDCIYILYIIDCINSVLLNFLQDTPLFRLKTLKKPTFKRKNPPTKPRFPL